MAPQVTPRKYRIERYLAEGGMGAIYLGKKLGPGGFEKEVVLKQLLPEFTTRPEFRDLFFREAKISATLDHVNIVRTFDLVRSEDALFIVMEYVRGTDLRTISWRARRRRRALSPAAVLHVAIEILSGLSYAHSRRSARGEPLGIIHRDVSPSNILCSAQGEVKLSDFGIAKAVTFSSVFYRVRGKVGYMSPEQARNQPLDARSDLFSLAVCIFETLMGERLYTGDLQTPADVIYAQPIPSLLEKCPGLPPELELVMRQALAQDRDQRFEDAAAFAQALRQVARRSGILYTSPELSAELASLLGGNADRWLTDESPVSVVTQGMPEPRELEGKEAASIGIVDLEGSPSPRSPDSRTVPIMSASAVGLVADPDPTTSLQAAAAARRPSSQAIPVARPSAALDSTGVAVPVRRRSPRRLLWASAAALLVGLLAIGVLGPDDNPLTSALRSLRHKISFWRE
jgi:serine/threonine protein kinase